MANMGFIKKIFGGDEYEVDSYQEEMVVDEHSVITPNFNRNLNRITKITPTDYSEAMTLARTFREGIPVLLNLNQLDHHEFSKFFHFTLGLSCGLGGHLEKVNDTIYLLTPMNVELNSETELSDTGEFLKS